METLINSTSIGNIIITAGSVILLLVLIKLFAWEQLTGIFTAREEKIANDVDGAEAARKEAEALAAVLEEKYPDCEVEVNNGGQPIYYYIISVE